MEKLKFENKLIDLYEYIGKHKNEPQLNKILTLNLDPDVKADDFFVFITNAFNFNRLPKIASKKLDLSKFQEMYRGAKKKTYHANLLVDTADRYYGTGAHGNGIYCTCDKNLAGFYGAKDDSSNIMEFKLMTAQVVPEKMLNQFNEYLSGKKLIDDFFMVYGFDFLHNMPSQVSEYSLERLDILKMFLDSLKNQEIKEKFLQSLIRDPSKLAIILGYDAITVFKENPMNVIVLNRNKITVSREEYDRIYDTEERRVRPFKPQNEIYYGE